MANQTLQNLKRIHELQKEGEINKILLNIRSSKSKVDTLHAKLSSRRKDIELAEAKEKEKIQREKEQESVTQQNAIAKEQEHDFVAQQKTEQTEQPVFENPNNKSRDFSNSYNRKDTPFAPNRQKSFGDRTQGNRQGNFSNGRNGTFNRDKNGKPIFGNRPPQNGTRPQFQGGNKRFGNNNFVSTKGNNFKSFASNDAPEIDVKNDRNYANKTKFAQKHNNSYDEKKKQTLRREEGKRGNIFIEDENGFEEISFGSRKSVKKKKETTRVVAPAIKNAVLTSKEITVKDFSEKIGKPVTEIVKKLMLLGVMATINSTIDYETAELVATDLGITIELKIDKTYEEKLIESAQSHEEGETLIKRPPIVAVMGHVDHGKTSLLDAFRKTNIVAGEAGGITQSIGAYQIEFNGEKITFIDTPGHAAFTQMRARGAKATDIAILVVAADDGVMPQTVEAINHIKAANCPIIVAINKMDKPEANPDRIKQQLAEHNVLPEEWGGDAICVPISAKTGLGLDNLKQTILLVAEMQELKANPDKMATGVIIEAELDKNRGPVASMIVQNGTLHVGDSIMSGITYGKVRAMIGANGKPVKVAGPSTPVEILGFNEVPASGDQVYAVEETLSKQVIQERIDNIKKERAKHSSGVTLDNFMNRVQEGTLKNLNVILKADTVGSVEALKNTLLTIRNEEAKVNIVHSGAGGVTEGDIVLAQTTGSVIISFNQKTPSKVSSIADNLKVQIKEYKIIYEVVDDITDAINGMLSVKYQEVYIGNAEIRMVFKLSTAGKIAGSYIKDGKATRNCIAIVKRDNEELGKTTVESLKIVKDEKAEVTKGYECGIKLKDNIDIKEGDIIEFYAKEVVKR